MPIYQLLRSKAITGYGKLGKVRALSRMYVGSFSFAVQRAVHCVGGFPCRRWNTRFVYIPGGRYANTVVQKTTCFVQFRSR